MSPRAVASIGTAALAAVLFFAISRSATAEAMSDAARAGDIDESADSGDYYEIFVSPEELFLMPGSYQLSQDGADRLKQREGFSAAPYFDFHGYSIGYGHLDIKNAQWNAMSESEQAAYMQKRVSREEADALFVSDVEWAQEAVSELVAVPLTQNQYDALVSFVFNIGRTAFANSTLLTLLNGGDYEGAAGQFPRWNRAGGQVNSGLIARRASELEQFTGEA